MGSYANLWISDAPSAVNETKIATEILAKWEVPLGWLVLFEPADFTLESVVEDDETYQVLYSSKLIKDAIRLLDLRTDLCASVGGQSWMEGYEQFRAFLLQHDGEYVHVGYSGLMDDDFPARDQRQLYLERINNLREPAFVEKKTLFGRTKIRLTEHWRLLVPDNYKYGVELPCWAWFGAPPDGKEDWV